MTARQHNRAGMKRAELETPCLLLELDAMERNLQRMAAYFATTPAKLRPHTKTHKTPALAQRQLEACLPSVQTRVDDPGQEKRPCGVSEWPLKPAHAGEMYAPEVFGRSEAGTVKIVAQEPLAQR